MKTSVKELPDSRVRVEVDVDAADFDRRVERAARGLGSELRIPGFRKGKVPAQVVIQRVGREAVMEEALREALPEWYERALLETGVIPVGDPKLDVAGLPSEGKPLSFSIEVAVRPEARLGSYSGLEVGKAEPEVPEEAVNAELERLREGFGSLRPVERAARAGDSLLVDYRGEIDGEPFEGGETRDFLLELGAEGLLEGFDEALTGAQAGDEREVQVRFPDDYRPERLAGKDATFTVDVKEVRRHRSSTRSPSSARTSRRRSARRSSIGPRTSFARRRSTLRSSRRRSRCPTTSSPRARQTCGSGSSARSRGAGSPRKPTCGCRTAPARS
jgi:trigger factor